MTSQIILPSQPSSILKSILRYINKCFYFTFLRVCRKKYTEKDCWIRRYNISKQRVKDHLWLSVLELRKIVANSQTNKSQLYHAKNSQKKIPPRIITWLKWFYYLYGTYITKLCTFMIISEGHVCSYFLSEWVTSTNHLIVISIYCIKSYYC